MDIPRVSRTPQSLSEMTRPPPTVMPLQSEWYQMEPSDQGIYLLNAKTNSDHHVSYSEALLDERHVTAKSSRYAFALTTLE